MSKDILYVGDIPSDYKYAIFGDNYIDLYKEIHLQGTLDFYRVYLYDNLFEYEHLSETYPNNNTTIATFIETTDNYMYRRDFDSICFIGLLNVLVIVLLLNVVTSVFRKGGISPTYRISFDINLFSFK